MFARQFLFAYFIALMIPCAAHAGFITFFDGTFNNADWTVPLSHGLNWAEQVGGGNPGSHRETGINSYQTIDFAAQLNTNFVYNPSTQGAITGLTWAGDSITTNGIGASGYLLIQQAGVLYFAPLSQANFTSWNVWDHFSRTLSPSDFTSVNPNSGNLQGGGSPDFTSTGSAIDFGYLIQPGGGGFFTSATGIDNYSLTVSSAPSAVPEPSSFALFSLGVAALAGYSRLRRKDRQKLCPESGIRCNADS